MSISKIAQLVNLRHTFVSIYKSRWIIVKLSANTMILDTHVLSRKKDIRNFHAQIQYRSKENCFRAHSSADSVRYETMQQTSHSYASVNKALSAITATLGARTLRLDHGSSGESCHVGWMTFYFSTYGWQCQGTPSPRWTPPIAPPYTVDHTQSSGHDIVIWRKF